MKYTLSIELNLPLEKVIELFDNPDNMKYWQEGFISFEHLSGEAGMPGAKSKLRYKMGKNELEMIETISVRDLPREFSGTYEAKGVWNAVNNYFSEPKPGVTKWVAEQEFKFKGFLKIIGFLMPGMFKKQSYKFMTDFKKFAEGAKV